MKIAIDCRYFGKSGIGRFLEGMLDNLPVNHEFILIGNPSKLSGYENYEILSNYSNPFSMKGLFGFSNKIINECDAIFIPHFVVPFGIHIPIYTVIHDLIPLEMKELNNGYKDYIVKKHLLKRCIRKSKKIFTVSLFSKSRIDKVLNHQRKEVIKTYVGLSKPLIEFKKNHPTEKVVKQNYIVFVGNIKKHKGIDILIEAFNSPEVKSRYELLIIGEATGYREDNSELFEKIINSGATFVGKKTDFEMFELIQKASFLVQPSRYEGFGVPPLEALYLGTKPIISNIEVFKEIYSDFDVVFFDINSVEDLKSKIVNSDPKVKIKSNDFDDYRYSKSAEDIFGQIVGDYEK